MANLSVAGGIDDFESGLVSRSVVIFGTVAVFVSADLIGQSDQGCRGRLGGVGGFDGAG